MINKIPYRQLKENGICEYCKKDFIKIQPNQKFCSTNCNRNYYKSKFKRITIKVKCKYCNKEFEKYTTSHKIYCSKECSYLHRKISYPKWDVWELLKEERLEIDNYTCVDCGSHDNLVTHHIMPLSFGGGNDIDNLVTICKLCHTERHSLIIKNLHGIVRER
jgi:5-methylcytosine-specific restriction endonuclease McrA